MLGLQELQSFLISEEKPNWLPMIRPTQVKGKLLWSHLLLLRPTPQIPSSLCSGCTGFLTVPAYAKCVPSSGPCCSLSISLLRYQWSLPSSSMREGNMPPPSLSPISPYATWFLPHNIYHHLMHYITLFNWVLPILCCNEVRGSVTPRTVPGT